MSKRKIGIYKDTEGVSSSKYTPEFLKQAHFTFMARSLNLQAVS